MTQQGEQSTTTATWYRRAERALYWAVIVMFLGRAWQHFLGDAPYRGFFWNENWWGTLVPRLTGLTWNDYVKSEGLTNFLYYWQMSVGVVFLVAALLLLFQQKREAWIKWTVRVTMALLLFLFLLRWQQKFYVPAMLLEHSAQLMVPLFWYWLRFERLSVSRWLILAKLVIAFTFVSHGLYALNVYPRPGHFVQMFISTLGVSEANAIHLLNLAGVMDMLIALAFLTKGRWVRWALLYAVFWGVMTTIARLWANVYVEFFWSSLAQWLGPFLYRFPHFLLPLGAYFMERGRAIFEKGGGS